MPTAITALEKLNAAFPEFVCGVTKLRGKRVYTAVHKPTGLKLAPRALDQETLQAYLREFPECRDNPVYWRRPQAA